MLSASCADCGDKSAIWQERAERGRSRAVGVTHKHSKGLMLGGNARHHDGRARRLDGARVEDNDDNVYMLKTDSHGQGSQSSSRRMGCKELRWEHPSSRISFLWI
jgi:hypothetical protein